MGQIVKLRVDSLTIDSSIQIRRQNHEDVIARYEELLDVLPPIVVYRVIEDGKEIYLVSDGFHRTAAHIRQGRTEISAEVREGSRNDALEYAVIANAKSGMPLTREERDEGIRRLHMLHPSADQKEIATKMSVPAKAVSRALQIQEIRRHVLSRKLQRIPDSIISEVAPASKEHWQPLLEAADRRGWTVDGVRQAVKNLSDNNLPDQQKRRILEGAADPMVESGQGDYHVPLKFITKKAQRSRKPVPRDPVGDDVAERLQPVRVFVRFDYFLESTQTRNRGLKQYKREADHIERGPYEIVVNHEALEGFGDAQNPQSKGLVMLLRQINRDLWRRLNTEGWPRQESVAEGPRPGVV